MRKASMTNAIMSARQGTRRGPRTGSDGRAPRQPQKTAAATPAANRIIVAGSESAAMDARYCAPPVQRKLDRVKPPLTTFGRGRVRWGPLVHRSLYRRQM